MSPINLFYNAARKRSPDCPFEFMFAQRCIIWGSVDIWGMKSFGVWLEMDVFNGRCHWKASVYSSVFWIGKSIIRDEKEISTVFLYVVYLVHSLRSVLKLIAVQNMYCGFEWSKTVLLSCHSCKVYIKCLQQIYYLKNKSKYIILLVIKLLM